MGIPEVVTGISWTYYTCEWVGNFLTGMTEVQEFSHT